MGFFLRKIVSRLSTETKLLADLARYFINFRGAHPIYRAVWENPVYRDGKLVADAAKEPKSDHWEGWGLAIRPDDPKDKGRLSAWTL